MKELITYLAKSLVKYPDDVEISERTLDDNTLEFTIRVNPDDMGKIIGRNGRTAQAIRQLMSARGSLENRRTQVEIAEEDDEFNEG